MPGYEPFLLCDFHVHTRWSDGKLSVAEVVDLYGSTGKFDVIAITDHILMKNDLLARERRYRADAVSRWIMGCLGSLVVP
jgi:predicted metal-dependent phosphoesterase TrpH